MREQTIRLTNGHVHLLYSEDDGRLRLERLTTGEDEWIAGGAQSDLFTITAGGQAYGASSLACTGVRHENPSEGVIRAVFSFSGPGLSVEQRVDLFDKSSVVEFALTIRNTGSAPAHITRVDSLSLNLPKQDAELFYYTGNWGSEFEPHTAALSSSIRLESRSGRSTKGNHPWFALTSTDGKVFSGSVAWSGNWVMRFEPLHDSVRLSGGLNDWEFAKDLMPGEEMQCPPFVLAVGNDLNAVSQQYARVGRRHWYPRNALSSTAPVEWNHWWPYEDAEINETVFAQNVETAQPMGFEVCTLDAGWFGPADAGTFWEHYRGDWHLVNAERFPNGIRSVADHVHAHGMKFGIWCEIEGLGEKAQVAIDHPEYVALRDGQRVGNICFGNPQAQEWAFQTLSRLITEYRADWIKVDYNLDQGAGCNRTDHGHGAGDGLYEHYQGYYSVMGRIRVDYPEVVLENCSSGGLRIDLGIMRHTHMVFLSDPDWAVHDLQIFWGASTMLAPDVLLHWTYSHWRNLNPPPYQTFDPRDPNLTQKKWDYYTRISMLGLYGLSQRLPDLPAWLRARIATHNKIYKDHVRRFVKEADLYRLTGQPRRSGEGDRWAAFQYRLPDGSEHLLSVFRLPGAEPQRRVRLCDLDPERTYAIEGFEGETMGAVTGRELMEAGLLFDDLEEEDSALLRLR